MSDNGSNDAKRGSGESGGGDYKRTKTTAAQDDHLNDIFHDPVSFNTNGEGSIQNSTDPLDFDFDKLPGNFLDSRGSAGSSTNQNTGAPISNVNSNMNLNMGSNIISMNNNSMSSLSLKQEADMMKRPLQQYPLTSGHSSGSNLVNINASDKLIGEQKLHTNDPTKLNDAIAAAGVDIQQEEELLLQQQQQRHFGMRQGTQTVKLPPFLHSYHVAAFMNKVAKENGIQQNFLQDADLLDLISTSCETWLSNIITKTVILSQHRRRGIPQNLLKKAQDKKALPAIPRSELSKELRNLAVKQKELEEKRVNKRIVLGLEKTSNDGSDATNGDGKAGAEETLHRAANATAAMMTMNPGRKKYSWMTAGSTANNEPKAGVDTPIKGKQSSIISVRGDNGLRFREIRSGNTVNMKDLLTAIEDERIGTMKAVLKGYAKLKE